MRKRRFLGCRRALTLVEIVIAVAIFGIAIVRMIATLHEQYRRSQLMGDTRIYADRAKSIMLDLMETVPYRAVQDAMEKKGEDAESPLSPSSGGTVVVPSSGDHLINQDSNIVFNDLREIKWVDSEGNDMVLIEMDNTTQDNGDTLAGKFKVDGEGRTYFQSKGSRYYFSLRILNQPMHLFYLPHNIIAPSMSADDRPSLVKAGTIKSVPATSMSGGDEKLCRDMLKKIVLTIKWEAFGRSDSYSFVAFKANLGDDYENI